MRWADDSPHLIVRMARPALVARLEALLQAPAGRPLVFDLGVPLDQPALAPLVHFIDCLRHTLDAGNALQATQALARHAEEYLLTSLLMSATHSHSRALAGDSRRSLLPRGVRKAQEYMQAHADQPLSLADVCREAGCSARTLQAAFRQHAGMGPMDFLRQLRLDRVRAELQAAKGPAPQPAPACATWRRNTASCTWATSRPSTAAASASSRPRRRAAACRPEGLPLPVQPRPTKGILVAITVWNSTLASSGRLAM